MLVAEEPGEMEEEVIEETPQLTEHSEPDGDEGGNYLNLPESFQPPEDKQMGQEFTGTYRGYVTEDGRLCVTAINEIPLKGEEPKAGEPHEDAEADSAEKASASPSNAQDEGGEFGPMDSTPEIKESKKLKKLLNGR